MVEWLRRRDDQRFLVSDKGRIIDSPSCPTVGKMAVTINSMPGQGYYVYYGFYRWENLVEGYDFLA